MEKNKIRAISIIAIAFVTFTVIAFLPPFVRNGVFVTSYIFGLIAIAVAPFVMYVAFKDADSIRSRFYGFPVARIGIVYAVVQILLSILFMGLSALIPLWLVLIVNMLLLSVSAVGFIGADITREQIENTDKKLAKDVHFIRELQSKTNFIATQCKDEEIKKTLQTFAENVRYSDPVSSEHLKEIENELSVCTDDLQQAVVDGESNIILQLCERAETLLSERNRLCKLHKMN